MVFGGGAGRASGYQTMNDEEEDISSSPPEEAPAVAAVADVEQPPSTEARAALGDDEEEILVEDGDSEMDEEEFMEEEVVDDDEYEEVVEEFSPGDQSQQSPAEDVMSGASGEVMSAESSGGAASQGEAAASTSTSDVPLPPPSDVENPSTQSRDPPTFEEQFPFMQQEQQQQQNPQTISQKAPSPPADNNDAPPEQAPPASTAVRAPSMIDESLSKSNITEAEEDKFLSSMAGLTCIGILIFVSIAGIMVGTGLGIAKPFQDESSPTPSPNYNTSAPTTPFPTFAPVPLTPEDEELLDLWATVVGDGVYDSEAQPPSPYYEAGQWMLYRDPTRVKRRHYEFRRHLQEVPMDYTNDELDYIQRYLLVFLYFATTDNGRQPWLSCNPVGPEYVEEECMYEKAIRKTPTGEILYESIPWTRWLSGANECDWAGVTCVTTSEGRLAVSEIDLGGQGLEANMDMIVELMKLPEVKSLSFAYNQLWGPLQSAFETLDLLDLTDNQLTGPLILLGGLSSLILEGNFFTGTLPTELFEFTTPLRHLNLGNNQLAGNLPAEVSFALKLTSLSLNDNRLTGTIPPEVGQLPLLSLRLQGNDFVGPVPIDTININWLDTLEELWLSDNALTGGIPGGLGSATRLQELRLSQNRLDGLIPAEVYSLDRLYRLELADNQLQGTIPISLVSQLTNLEVLDLSGNQFQGRILLDNRLTNLQSLRLEFNQFTGTVPESLCEIGSLNVLSADCAPSTDPPNPCSCCTACCSRESQVCSDDDTSSPVAAPSSGPRPTAPTPTAPPVAAPTGSEAGVSEVQQWARDTFGDNIDQSNGTPHSLASIWISTADSLALTPDDSTFFQRYVLAHFYFSTRTWKSCNPASTTSCLYEKLIVNDDQSISYEQTVAKRWLASISECDWVGVLCSSSGDVTGFDLAGQEIKGTLPTELVALPTLDTLNLGYNELSGTISGEFGLLSQLSVLKLNDNQFSGTIPAQLGTLSALQVGWFNSNDLAGAMPSDVCALASLESLQTDCDEMECSCCTACCTDGEGCSIPVRK